MQEPDSENHSWRSPLTELKRGFAGFPAGLRWLRHHPFHFFVLALPLLFGLGALVLVWGAFFRMDEQIIGWLLFSRPEGFFTLAVYYFAKAFLYASFFLMSLVMAVLLANIIACPIYDWVSIVVEREFIGGDAYEISLWESLRLIGEEIKKVSFILLVSLVVLFIPVINLFAIFISAFLVGWDVYDYPLARRGWSFKARLRFGLKDFWAITAFGFWLMIPFVQVILIPLAISGASLLSLQSLQRHKMLAAMQER